uniref:WD repeat-containing protein 79 n=1 Tax=Romanomermis culicivorax TaxID=13658 RepID=A0A915HNQ1_ROMCU
DEKVAAHSVSFSLDGCKVYAGFKKCIRIFDFFRPGKQIETRSTAGDKHLGNGQSGIISTITMCPTLAGCYACGSYDRSIAIYADELPDPQFVLQGQIGGVTHLMYSPDGHCLFSGGRK